MTDRLFRFLERRWREAVVLGLLLRLAAVLATPVFPLVDNTWDATFYHEVALSLAQGAGYTFDGNPTALFPPGYALALSAPYSWFGSEARAGQCLNLAASMLLLLFAARLAFRLSGASAAKRTAAWLALDPTQIVMPAFLMSETLCAAWLAAALLAVVQARDHGSRWLFAGLFLVAAGFTRGHAFLVVPAVVLVWWWRHELSARRAVPGLLVMAVLTLVAVGGWAARNDRVLGAPVLLATNSGMNLLLGNNENARGGRADPPGGLPVTGDEVQDEKLSRQRALEYMRTHPGRTLLFVPVKAARLLLPAPVVTYRAELREKWGSLAAGVTLGVAQAVFWLGWVLLWTGRRRIPSAARLLVVAALGAWILGHLPFLGGARYFFPVSFLVVLAAALGSVSARAPLSSPTKAA